MKRVPLKRVFGTGLLAFYGLGTIIGAGIYVLIGEVAALASVWMPLSFLVAGLVAGFTAMSYADLATRLPVSAGEAAYAQAAWGRDWIARLTGVGIVLTGIVSAATIAKGFVGYLNEFIAVGPLLAVSGLVFVLSAVAAWGIRSSAWLILVITLAEAGGLLYCIFLAFTSPDFSLLLPASPPLLTDTYGIILGSILAFYAFIGFEDMVNVIEEVKNPARTFPRAIIIAFLGSITLYGLLSVAALGAVGVDALAESDAPMTTLVRVLGGSTVFISLVSLLAVVNGALVQIIMGSRVIYGMAIQQLLPVGLGYVSPMTKTPVVATVLVGVCVLVFALLLPVESLARITSLLMLTVFVIVNLALLVVRRRSSNKAFSAPAWSPYAGVASAGVLIVFQLWHLI